MTKIKKLVYCRDCLFSKQYDKDIGKPYNSKFMFWCDFYLTEKNNGKTLHSCKNMNPIGHCGYHKEATPKLRENRELLLNDLLTKKTAFECLDDIGAFDWCKDD